jgi:hypothetical protein
MRLEDPSSLDSLESRFFRPIHDRECSFPYGSFPRGGRCFVLVPPNFDPEPGFPEARAIGAALRSPLEAARPKRVVLSFHHRSAGQSAQPADTAHDYRTGAQRFADADHISASGVVYGKLPVGCDPGARAWSDSEFPSTARQAGADGGYNGYWETGRCLAARTVERPPRGGIGRTAPRDSKRDRRCIHEGPGPVSANANRAARFLGGTFQVAGDEEPTASDADAEWL